ncbi:MAG: hypothetical protein AAF716_15645 [Cyanobacteria bacterium P01_D01_bin.1]
MQVSPNFAFLKVHDRQLVRLGSQAEQYFSDDPNNCLIKLRQFGELLAQLMASAVARQNFTFSGLMARSLQSVYIGS